MDSQKKKYEEMKSNQQIKKFILAVGYSNKTGHKKEKMAQNGKFEHKIDIDENEKKVDVKKGFQIIIDS